MEGEDCEWAFCENDEERRPDTEVAAVVTECPRTRMEGGGSMPLDAMLKESVDSLLPPACSSSPCSSSLDVAKAADGQPAVMDFVLNTTSEVSRSRTSISGRLQSARGSLWMRSISLVLAEEQIDSALDVVDESMGSVGVCVCKDGERVKGKSIFMLETDRRGGGPCADDPRLELLVCVLVCVLLLLALLRALPLVTLAWYGACSCAMKLREAGTSVTANSGSDMEVAGEPSGGRRWE